MSRPSALENDPGLIDKIVKNVKRGLYLETAAELSGVPRATFFEWLRKGRSGKSNAPGIGLYRRLVREVEEALAWAEARDADLIRIAAKTQWQAAAWRLERRFPERWALRQIITNLAETKSDENTKEVLETCRDILPPDMFELLVRRLSAPAAKKPKE